VTVRLFGAFAHPDDDVYQIGGTLAMHAGDVQATLVFATSGEAGPITDPAMATRETLGVVREHEQRAALEALGVAAVTDVHFLRHPDYHLSTVPFDDLVAEVAEIMRATQPDVVVTFGPDGLTSHHDHIRIGRACSEAFHRVGHSGAAPPARLFHTALPRSIVDRFYAGLSGLGETSYGEEGRLFNLVGVPDDRIAVRADVGGVARRKLDGILAHRTQLCEWERIPEPLRWVHLDEESFVQAWPPSERGEPAPDLITASTEAGETGARGE
jgi:LmbE family N-acetylglucosaminyl deacetylase